MSDSSSRRAVMIEGLESRRFFSTTLLGPSAVEGSYKGDVTVDGVALELKLVVTPTSETLTVVGRGSAKATLGSKGFIKLREGVFAYEGTIKGVLVKLNGDVTARGTRIDGDYSASAKGTTETGDFILKKVV